MKKNVFPFRRLEEGSRAAASVSFTRQENKGGSREGPGEGGWGGGDLGRLSNLGLLERVIQVGKDG